jgi:hypothetical protein
MTDAPSFYEFIRRPIVIIPASMAQLGLGKLPLTPSLRWLQKQ